MTAVPPPVPPEIVRRAAEAMEDAAMRWLGRDLGTIHRDDIAAEGIAAVYGDIVEAARRDCAAETERLRFQVEGMSAEVGLGDDARDRLIDERNLHAGVSRRVTAERDAVLAEVERLRTMLDAVASDVTQSLADRDRAVRDARWDALDHAAEAIERHAGPVQGGVRVGVSAWQQDRAVGYTAAVGEVLDVVAGLRDSEATG